MQPLWVGLNCCYRTIRTASFDYILAKNREERRALLSIKGKGSALSGGRKNNAVGSGAADFRVVIYYAGKPGLLTRSLGPFISLAKRYWKEACSVNDKVDVLASGSK